MALSCEKMQKDYVAEHGGLYFEVSAGHYAVLFALMRDRFIEPCASKI